MTSGTKTIELSHAVYQYNATTYMHNFYSYEQDSGITDGCIDADEDDDCSLISSESATFRPIYRLNEAARRYAV